MAPDDILPWAAKVHAERKPQLGAGFMTTTCLPFGPIATIGMREGPARIIQNANVIGILFTDMTYRQIHLDGRELPKDPNPAWMGYSVGHWEGDALIVGSNGFNEKTWLDIEGHPHTEQLRVTERIRRRDFGHLDLEVTFNDPGAYRRAFTVKRTWNGVYDTEIIEFLCNENERDARHLLSTSHPAQISVETLRQYVGRYRSSAMAEMVVTIEGTELMLQTRAFRGPLVPVNDTYFEGNFGSVRFNLAVTPATLEFSGAGGTTLYVSTK
jgi:hypothetical protein